MKRSSRAFVSATASAIALASAFSCGGEIRLGLPSAPAGTDETTDGGGGDSTLASAGASRYGTCTSETDCLLETLHCALATGTCVECREDGDCRSDDRPRCDATSGRCIGCRGDADCGVEKRCESSIGTCVERCSTSRPCSVGTCEVASGKCIECGPGIACSDGDVCNAAGICVACTDDAQCAAAGEEPYCDPLLGRCVRCTSRAQCDEARRCDPASGECRGP